MIPRNWVLAPATDASHKTAGELNLHPRVAEILSHRGFTTAPQISDFLDPSLENLKSPFAFVQMHKAVDRIASAVRKRETILIYGDYDVDGITGSAILCPILKRMGADVEVHIPHRIREGYGLNLETLKRLLQKKFTLMITVDNGITGADAIRFLNEKGVDTIIVDHHLPKAELPAAYAILSGGIGGAEDSDLAACGVAFKLGWALLGSLEKAKEYLDLTAVGTVADLAPVTGENRILLVHGLRVLSAGPRIGLAALMKEAGLSPGSIRYRDIAFGLGPRINASGRMGSPMDSFKLLVTDSALEAQNLAQILGEGNRERQKAEARVFDEALQEIDRLGLAETEKIFVLANQDWHEGVLGIVASRLVDRYQKPSIVIALRQDVGKGSGRSTPAFSLFDSVRQCEDILLNFGGHAQALGLTLKREDLPVFRKRVNEAARREGFGVPVSDLAIEAEIEPAELSMKFLQDLERLAPFGPGNRKPFFLSRGMRVRSEVKKRGQDTLHCWMTDPKGKMTCEVVGFRSYRRWASQERQAAYDIVYQPALREWAGIASVQLDLEDWR